MYDLYVPEGFADVSFETKYDERADSAWVKSVTISSKRSGWYQIIKFEGPNALDNLVYALVTAKAEARSMHSYMANATVQAVRDANHTDFVCGRKDDGLYHCPWCYEPIPDEPKADTRYCPACGVKLTGFEID